jgi:hypothetical protein
MNEHFRIAQKLGLMFLPNTTIPEDISSWAIAQLHVKSPALGIKQVRWHSHKPKVLEWPQSLQPNLQKRDEMFWALKENMEKIEEICLVFKPKLTRIEIDKKISWRD